MSDDNDFKILITGDASNYVEAGEKASTTTEQLKEETGKLSENSEETGKKLEQQGDHATSSAGKHAALRHLMGELNRISPGLGEAMHLLAHAYTEAGESAEGGAVGLAEFNVALEEVLTTLGPLIIAMLAIEATFQYWDMYKQKVKGAADAQEEATKRILESTRQALAAVQELDEAMHPQAHDAAHNDEAELKKRQQQTENEFTRQRELNKATEEREEAAAGSPEAKEQIRKRFEVLDQELQVWRDKQKVANQEAIMGTMQSQLDELKTAEDELTKQSTEAFKRGNETKDFTDYDTIQKTLKTNADEAKAIREKLDSLTEQHALDAGNVEFNSETDRRVDKARGQKYNEPGNDIPFPNAKTDNATDKFFTGQTIADTASRGGKVSDAQQQFLTVLEQTITGRELTFQQAVALMEAQSKSTDFATTLIANAQSRIDAVNRRLDQLQAWAKNSNINHL